MADEPAKRLRLDNTGAIVPIPAPVAQQIVEFRPPGRFPKPKKAVVEEDVCRAVLTRPSHAEPE